MIKVRIANHNASSPNFLYHCIIFAISKKRGGQWHNIVCIALDELIFYHRNILIFKGNSVTYCTQIAFSLKYMNSLKWIS